MKKTFVSILLLCATVVLCAQSAKSCFKNLPDSLAPLLTSVNRADFIDFLESNMKAEVTNRFGGKSEMKMMTDDYILIQPTPQSTWQMKLLPLNDSVKVVCTVSTVSAPVSDSRFCFYTTDWQELPLVCHLPSLPGVDDFITQPADTTPLFAYQEARRQADICFLKAELSPTEPVLTFIFTTPDYMEKEAVETLKPYLRRSMKYVWKEGRFTLP
ncbi:MAG: DUF3256 family protein [Bacteroides sp.]|nr:DUF3256 family protein [Bacteroides sp.]